MKNRNEWPIEDLTPARLYALELLARRQRAEEVRKQLARVGRFVKSLTARFSAQGGNGVRHA